MNAIIYRPARNAMQSGKGKSKKWLLIHEPASARRIEPLMGYTSSTDTNTQVKLSFNSLQEAVDYAKRQGLAYRVQPPHNPSVKRSVYTDNFQNSRKIPWTH